MERMHFQMEDVRIHKLRVLSCRSNSSKGTCGMHGLVAEGRFEETSGRCQQKVLPEHGENDKVHLRVLVVT